MKKSLLIASAFLFLSTATHAKETTATCQIDPNLSITEISIQLEKCKAKNASEKILDVEKIADYGDVAKGIAEAIGIAARELGVAVNEFVDSDAGKLTVALIIWHIFGGQILSIVASLIGIYVGFKIFRRTQRYFLDTGEVKEYTGWFGIKHKKPVFNLSALKSEGDTISWVCCNIVAVLFVVFSILCLAN